MLLPSFPTTRLMSKIQHRCSRCQYLDIMIRRLGVRNDVVDFLPMPPERDERFEHLAEVLKSVIRSSGLTGREIDRRLGMSGGYTSRLLGGGVELKLSQILAILDVIGLYPSELFAMAFPMSG